MVQGGGKRRTVIGGPLCDGPALRGKAGDQCGPRQGTEDVISDFDSVASAFQTGEDAGIRPWPALVHGPGVT